MAHPAKPDDHAHLRSIIDRLNSDSWSGWHGRDVPLAVRDQMTGDVDVEDMIAVVESRAQERLEEYEDRQEFTPPSKERREAKERAEHRVATGQTSVW